ncbi:MAG: hypothetical protein IJT94_06230 [Oscillibacter sp.]|nr:hypothetical protein [Oscillibacter sp.]
MGGTPSMGGLAIT